MYKLLLAALFVLISPRVRAQQLPFDHWLNLYWQIEAASRFHEPAVSMIWPPGRQMLARFVRNAGGSALPEWVRRLVAAELKSELAAAEGDPQWDRWTVGAAALTGERPAAPSDEPSYYLFADGLAHFHPALTMYARIRVAHEPSALPAFSALPRRQRRLSFNSAESDYAFLAWLGSWFAVRAGRLKESWGPGDARTVWLSAWGPAYDGLTCQLRYRRFTFRFLTAYLETVEDAGSQRDVHRYLTGHFLAYSNGRNFWVGAGETMLYAGPDRPLSLVYSNPFMTYQEYENNDRTNSITDNRDNWTMAVCWEWFPAPRLRTWGIWMIDDVQIDREKIPDATALRLGLSQWFGSPAPGYVQFEYVRIGTWTYRHQSPFINYVSRGLPLGYPGGSDLREYRLSWLGFPARFLTARAHVGYTEVGELNLLDDLYRLREFPNDWPFPSGTVQKRLRIGVALRYQPRYNFMVEAGLNWDRFRNYQHAAGRVKTSWSGFLSISSYFDFSVYPPKGK